MQKRWTEEHAARLPSLVKSGLSSEEVGRVLGFSPALVSERARRLGCPFSGQRLAVSSTVRTSRLGRVVDGTSTLPPLPSEDTQP